MTECANILFSKEVKHLFLCPIFDEWEDEKCPSSEAAKQVFVTYDHEAINYSQAKQNAILLADGIRQTNTRVIVKVMNSAGQLP